MSREEVLQMLSILKAAYPHSFQKLGKRDAESLANLWERQFADEDPRAVSAAIDSLIATRTVGYSPTIGEIKEQLHRLRNQDQLSEVDAWVLVERACRNGLHHAQEEFDKLPPDVQAAVGGPEQLTAWARMDSETVNSVIASNFRKSYATAQERAKHNAMLPPNVRAMLSEVADQMSIDQPKAPALIPAKLEPMKRQAILPPAEPTPERVSEYKPPAPDEWERRRKEALWGLEKVTGKCHHGGRISPAKGTNTGPGNVNKC